MKAILVTGSRDWVDRTVIHDQMMAHYERGVHHVLIHGDCRGVDRIAGIIASEYRWSVLPMAARWELEGRLAGPKRNTRMVEVLKYLRDCGYWCKVLGFPLPGSNGTWHMINIARCNDFDVWVYGEKRYEVV